MKIRTAIFPVAGLGTRFLPATKVMPKEMLPILNKPLIQYAVEEALEAGIEKLIFITARGKSMLIDHFDVAFEMEKTLEIKNRTIPEELKLAPGTLIGIRQQEPLGLGHAVWCARNHIYNEPFAVILPDDFIHGAPGCLKQMVDAYQRIGGNMVATQKVPLTDSSKYGMMDPQQIEGQLIHGRGVIEKPTPEQAPSPYAVIGRYILSPEIMDILPTLPKGAGGEIQLTDGLDAMIGKVPFTGYAFEGTRYDCGSLNGWLKANISLGEYKGLINGKDL